MPVGRIADLTDADDLWDEVRDVEDELGENGRVLVRPSGTEPVVRVMVEAASQSDARRYADRLTAATKLSFEKGVDAGSGTV